MTYMKNALFAAAFAISAPLAAQAATVNKDVFANNSYAFAEVLMPGTSAEYNFNVMEDLKVNNFSITANGNNFGADVGSVRYSVNGADAQALTISGSGESQSGYAFSVGENFSAGDVVQFLFSYAIKDDITLSLAFATGPADVAPVPLPAAGLLLGSLLVAGGTVAARKKK
ncbi:hypothetical protein [Pseudoruegeria sp. SK021]|uniref:hypothetical protein n=1 Tax=Pseudoruegeria sp. SK021 TaxID=1933035 RepID=UPI000A258F3F|nr:hypothetical protein [Pseudoruegeria sp. SK021]OSP54316.1 hypothetical protein BV911_13160 [Pseudoruegeria sp. SK021]